MKHGTNQYQKYKSLALFQQKKYRTLENNITEKHDRDFFDHGEDFTGLLSSSD